MGNMKLSMKITVLSSSLISLMVIAAIFGIIKMNKLGIEIVDIAENDIPITNAITEMAMRQQEQDLWLEKALRFGNISVKQETVDTGLKEAEHKFAAFSNTIDARLAKTFNHIKIAQGLAHTSEGRKDFIKLDKEVITIERLHKEYKKQASMVFSLINTGNIAKAEQVAQKAEHEARKLEDQFKTTFKLIEKFTSKSTFKADQDEQSGIKGLIYASLFSFIFGILVSWLITRSIVNPINNVVGNLNQGANQVAAASTQASSSSQQLADGASEQAAGLEEVSSSIEEMTAMTRQNSESSQQANMDVNETIKIVTNAKESMSQLVSAMEEVATSSEDTSQIVKTIDDIAFQTNLLALNAAVEAARAGEAGTGFAVVADEVRNLAMRASEAAKKTSELIESTKSKVANSNELLNITDKNFTFIAEKTDNISALINEISTASNEQSSGIGQINIAVSEMDKQVQENAANAEETASLSEELTAQAKSIKDEVLKLVTLVKGKSSSRNMNIAPRMTFT